MRYALPLVLLLLALTGCTTIGFPAIGLPEFDLPTRAHASRCADGQDLKQVWGVWQCVDH